MVEELLQKLSKLTISEHVKSNDIDKLCEDFSKVTINCTQEERLKLLEMLKKSISIMISKTHCYQHDFKIDNKMLIF
jgi:hypothetical protein